MSVAPILNGIANQNDPNLQSQRQKVQQQFQSIAQEFQSGDLTAAQASTLSEETLPKTSLSSSIASGIQNDAMGSNLRKHIRIDCASEGTSSNGAQHSGEQTSPSAALQAYNSLGQSLQQAEWGDDLTSAQMAGEISSLSLTV